MENITGLVKISVVRISVSIDKKYRIQSESMRCIAAWNLSSVRLYMVTDVFTVCEWVTGSIHVHSTQEVLSILNYCKVFVFTVGRWVTGSISCAQLHKRC